MRDDRTWFLDMPIVTLKPKLAIYTENPTSINVSRQAESLTTSIVVVSHNINDVCRHCVHQRVKDKIN